MNNKILNNKISLYIVERGRQLRHGLVEADVLEDLSKNINSNIRMGSYEKDPIGWFVVKHPRQKARENT